LSAGSQPLNADRRAELIALAGELRPELHRYCARLMGSVIDGEDVVQDTLARALVALQDLELQGLEEMPPLRPWLFRIAHNRALDLLRGRTVRMTEPIDAASDVADPTSPDPVEMLMRQEAVKTAVSRFAELPTVQRSVVILKDVLDEPLKEIAALLDLTVDAVKAHLARGRARLREINAQARPLADARPASAALAHYVALFNQRDWDGRRRQTASVHVPASRRLGGRRYVLHHLRQVRWRVAGACLARGPGSDRGLRRPRRSEAELRDVARVARRPDQFYPRLPLCPLCRH
jgi:RNA polymerase sigma factor (sigma-70 family)